MYAILETGGKQYRVSAGDVIDVELLTGEPGGEVVLDRVLVVADGSEVKVGAPTVEGAKVVARLVQHGKGRKIRGLKYKAKVNYRRRFGHRQGFSRLLIQSIEG